MTDLLDLPLAPDAPEPVAVDTDPTPPVEQPVPAKRATPRPPRSRREWFELVSTIVVVAGASLYVLAQLHPNLILTNTTPAITASCRRRWSHFHRHDVRPYSATAITSAAAIGMNDMITPMVVATSPASLMRARDVSKSPWVTRRTLVIRRAKRASVVRMRSWPSPLSALVTTSVT